MRQLRGWAPAAMAKLERRPQASGTGGGRNGSPGGSRRETVHYESRLRRIADAVTGGRVQRRGDDRRRRGGDRRWSRHTAGGDADARLPRSRRTADHVRRRRWGVAPAPDRRMGDRDDGDGRGTAIPERRVKANGQLRPAGRTRGPGERRARTLDPSHAGVRHRQYAAVPQSVRGKPPHVDRCRNHRIAFLSVLESTRKCCAMATRVAPRARMFRTSAAICW